MRAPAGSRRARAPTFLPLLIGILVVYAVIVGSGTSTVGQIARLVTFVGVLIVAIRISRRRGSVLRLAIGVGVGLGAIVLVAAFGTPALLEGTLAVVQFALVAAAIASLARLLASWRRVDLATVLGVLCVYLLLALLFAELYQLGSVIQDGFLRGVTGTPTASDCLYLSVITLATVGYGDITPATQFGRTIAITEALVGQLYLVSVVAAVVAGWRASRRDDAV